MKKMIKVRIDAEMRATFRQKVEMPESEYKRIVKLMDSDKYEERRHAEAELEAWLDFSDIHDMTDLEIDGFEEVVP